MEKTIHTTIVTTSHIHKTLTVQPFHERLLLLVVGVVARKSPKFSVHTRPHGIDVLNVQHAFRSTATGALVTLAHHFRGILVLPARGRVAQNFVKRLQRGFRVRLAQKSRDGLLASRRSTLVRVGHAVLGTQHARDVEQTVRRRWSLRGRCTSDGGNVGGGCDQIHGGGDVCRQFVPRGAQTVNDVALGVVQFLVLGTPANEGFGRCGRDVGDDPVTVGSLAARLGAMGVQVVFDGFDVCRCRCDEVVDLLVGEVLAVGRGGGVAGFEENGFQLGEIGLFDGERELDGGGAGGVAVDRPAGGEGMLAVRFEGGGRGRGGEEGGEGGKRFHVWWIFECQQK